VGTRCLDERADEHGGRTVREHSAFADKGTKMMNTDCIKSLSRQSWGKKTVYGGES